MTAKQRIKQLEKNAPKDAPKKKTNPYMAMSDAELLDIMKSIVESGEPETPEQIEFCKRAKQMLTNNGVEWTVKHGNE